MALRVVVMGVSGSGKSTIGRALAEKLGLPFVEGDSLHPAANVKLMAAGTPLTDADRYGWLQAVAAELAAARQHGMVVSCSALKYSYRELLRAGAPDLRLVHLVGEPSLLARRMHARTGHYMPPSLLQSQLDTLEAPTAAEGAITVDVETPVPDIVSRVQAAL
ncbi:MAG TPA: gluconokinase [Rubrivivax sp.]|nr:gluconokinase [Rubrivivax sp.]